MPNLRSEAQALMGQLVAWRRDFHRHPELAFEERRTAAKVAELLERLGYEVQAGVGKTGVVGILEGERAGKTALLRFDMDALPIEEANETEYASRVPGKMHACGHDGHTAIGLGVATLLARHRRALAGRVKLIFQPAEETANGARAMIADGVLNDPAPDIALGLHLWNSLPVGRAIVQAGPLMAAAMHFKLTIYGRGGHGAMPHEAIDALVTAAYVVTALQTIISRNVNPVETAVLSVGTFYAGRAFNVIADRAELSGTIRAFDEQLMAQMQERLRQVVAGVTQAFGATFELELEHAAPAVVNDPVAASLVAGAARRVLGDASVGSTEPVLVSEDMAEFLKRVPGCFFFLGSMNPERGLDYPHHHPRFDFDEAVLPLGVAILAEAAITYLGEQGESDDAATSPHS
ncbi:MAG: amidohydrolase [Anaerolineae bacterium]|nr:amidohydrolase [Anaerolineae bacterium]MDW8100734.1 amidohydrolase [Anaerolineae bacterium]